MMHSTYWRAGDGYLPVGAILIGDEHGRGNHDKLADMLYAAYDNDSERAARSYAYVQQTFGAYEIAVDDASIANDAPRACAYRLTNFSVDDPARWIAR